MFPVPVEKGISELNDLSNHPNPFNSSTTIRFSVQRQVDLHLEIVDVRGRKIRTLVNGVHESGGFEVVWDGCDKAGSAVASGVYYIRLQDGGRLIQVRSIVLIR